MSQVRQDFNPPTEEEFVVNVINKLNPAFLLGGKNKTVSDFLTITDTQMIAHHGETNSRMGAFFHKILQAEPAIKQVIALGDCLGTYYQGHQDFHNYMILIEQTNNEVQYYSQNDFFYRVEITACDAEKKDYDVYRLSKQIKVKNIINSELSITKVKNITDKPGKDVRKLNVTLLPIEDKFGLRLNEKMYRQLLFLYKNMYEEEKVKTLIHCKAGMGRTANMILTFKLLHVFDDIFFSDNVTVESAAEHIKTMIIDLQKLNPAFFRSAEQIALAIFNAHTLHNSLYGRVLLSAPKVFTGSRDTFFTDVPDWLRLAAAEKKEEKSNQNSTELRSHSL